MKRLFLFIGLSFVLISACQSQKNDLKRDIGEMLLVGFRGQSVDTNSHIYRDIKRYHVGSVILFERDTPTGKRHRNVASPSQLKKLCSQLQSFSDEKLLIGIDQEGGLVCRMRKIDGFPAVPSPKYCSEAGLDTVRHYADVTAKMLRAAGVNFDYAPVADVDVNPVCPVIGKLGRSFSADTARVADCCRIWLDRLAAKGVIGCMKHFPGHGSALGDTHKGLVDVSSTWKEYELAPYRRLMAEDKVPAIMVAHVINSKIDPVWPASLSRATVTDLLRKKMGYNGVIVTDDLAMGAIAKHYDYEEVLFRAIDAGCDLLCLSNNGDSYDAELVPKTVAIIVHLVETGRVSAEQIHASAERVRAMKNMIK